MSNIPEIERECPNCGSTVWIEDLGDPDFWTRCPECSEGMSFTEWEALTPEDQT